jgi:hypothetical protein
MGTAREGAHALPNRKGLRRLCRVSARGPIDPLKLVILEYLDYWKYRSQAVALRHVSSCSTICRLEVVDGQRCRQRPAA